MEEPEITTRAEQVAATASLMAKKIVIEEEPEQPFNEVPPPVSVQKTNKTVKAKSAKEIECANCGKKIHGSKGNSKILFPQM